MTKHTKIFDRTSLGLIVLAAALALGGCKKKNADASASDQPASFGPDCDAYVAAMEKFVSCDDKKFMAGQKDMYRKDLADTRKRLTESSKDDARMAAESETCKTALKGLDEAAKFRGCPLK